MARALVLLLLVRPAAAGLKGWFSSWMAPQGGPAGPTAPRAKLHNGLEMPMLGLGCSSRLRRAHVLGALQEGYRLVDTAQAKRWSYNESEVGDAVLESGIPREQIFIQTKIFPEDLGYEATLRAFPGSLERLKTTWVDSLLLHKPRCWKEACIKDPEGTWQESWKALEELYEAGKVKAIGICDVDDALLDELLQQKVKPHIIQNWMDPFRQDAHIRERCRAEGIQYQAYSTLGPQWVHFRGHAQNPVLTSPLLQDIAREHNRTVAQVVLNWALGHGVAVIPASKDPGRRRSNLNSLDFKLSAEEVQSIDALDGTLAKAGQVEIAFENLRGEEVDAFWVSPEGKEKRVGTIAPRGGRLSQTTVVGHTFRFKHGDTVLQQHVVRAEDRQLRRPIQLHEDAGHGVDFQLSPEEALRAFTTTASPTAEARGLDAVEEAGPMSIVFKNERGVEVGAYFVKADGAELPVGTIAPGASLKQTTFVGHRFRFKQGDMAVHEHVVSAPDRHLRGPIQLREPAGEDLTTRAPGQQAWFDVDFENLHEAEIDAYFVALDGAERSVGKLAPGAVLGQRTSIGHIFRFKLGDKVLHEHTVDARDRGSRVQLRDLHADL